VPQPPRRERWGCPRQQRGTATVPESPPRSERSVARLAHQSGGLAVSIANRVDAGEQGDMAQTALVTLVYCMAAWDDDGSARGQARAGPLDRALRAD
jgi:hypothetical protein